MMVMTQASSYYICMALPRSTMAATSTIYHVYSRGVERRQIFFERGDYARFIARLKKYTAEEGVEVLIRCPMPNHFHLLVSCDSIKRLSRFLHRLLTSYSKYFNLKYDRVGHLFQSRFQCKPVETQEYLDQLIIYIKNNPGPGERHSWLYLNSKTVFEVSSLEKARGA